MKSKDRWKTMVQACSREDAIRRQAWEKCKNSMEQKSQTHGSNASRQQQRENGLISRAISCYQCRRNQQLTVWACVVEEIMDKD